MLRIISRVNDEIDLEQTKREYKIGGLIKKNYFSLSTPKDECYTTIVSKALIELQEVIISPNLNEFCCISSKDLLIYTKGNVCLDIYNQID